MRKYRKHVYEYVSLFPTFFYWRNLSPSRELDFILSSRLSFRRSGFYNGWLSIVIELAGSSLMLKQDNIFFQGNYEQSITSLRTGLTYERRLNDFLFAGVKAGIQNNLNSQMRKLNAKSSHYVSESKRDPAPYLSFNLSFAPFIRKR